MLHLKTFVFNFISVNTYLLFTDEGEAMVVDCGAHAGFEKDKIKAYIDEMHLRPTMHLLTHGHFDHTFGCKFLHEEYGLAPHVHKAEECIYPYGKAMVNTFVSHNYSMDDLPPAHYFEEGEEFHLGSYTFRAIHTPGHTPGGVCYYCESEGILLSGDSLFAGSIGRCDFPLSDGDALLSALQTKILTLPPDTIVYPGHGSSSTIGRELSQNPFF